VIPETDDGPDTSTKLERQLSKLADSFKDFVNTRKRQEKVIQHEGMSEMQGSQTT
jgi:hypothetical protein